MITVKQLKDILSLCDPDQTVYLTVWRDGEREVVNDVDTSFIDEGFLEFNIAIEEHEHGT